MKLLRFGSDENEKPGLLVDDNYYDLSSFFADYNEAFFTSEGIEQIENIVKENKHIAFAIPKPERLGSPVARPSKIVCIGLNYANHAKETGAAIPAEPIIFMKSTTSLAGPFDNVVIPRDSIKTDWEVELAVVISKKASYVDEGEAMDYVAGYALHNDISEREFQLERGGTWDKGKGCDSFAPLGPWLVTKDEVANVDDLRLWLTVNGQKMQDGNTSDFIFRVPTIIAYVSKFMTLLPGDVISTGTPAGVGLGFNPPVYLKAGDVVELGIDGLGTSRQECVAWTKK